VPRVPRETGRWRVVASLLAALVPAGLAASGVANATDGGHDLGVARALGLDPQPWGSLDAAVASLFAALPVGTHAARAAMGGALVLAATGFALYVVARQVLSACAPAPRIGAIVAAIATGCAVLSPPWQLEGTVAGGAALGGLLALLPLVLLAGADAGSASESESPRWGLVVFLLALALGHDLLAGACALVSCAALVGVGPRARAAVVGAWRTEWRGLVACAAAGLAPLVVALARTRTSGASVLDVLLASGPAERGVSTTGAPFLFVQHELGAVLGALAVGGAVLSLLVPAARALAAGLTVAMVAGLASGWAGAALGPARFGPAVLAGLACACVLAGVSMQALVRAIAEARLPLAKASAAMVLVLELVAPVDEADDAAERVAARVHGGGVMPEEPAAAWDDAAWGALPPRAIVLVTSPRLWHRTAAARATGSIRGDLAIVPTFARGGLAARFLSRDPALVPLWRDLALNGTPTEESLSSLANERPVITAFEPAWGKVLGKHLVPAGLFDRFEPEPRGTSDRRKALLAFTGKRERLARAVARDHDLADAAAWLLRQRVLDMASSGDRNLVGGAVADLDAFAPGDPTGAQVVAKLVQGKPHP
jgi:hypothetical protein